VEAVALVSASISKCFRQRANYGKTAKRPSAFLGRTAQYRCVASKTFSCLKNFLICIWPNFCFLFLKRCTVVWSLQSSCAWIC